MLVTVKARLSRSWITHFYTGQKSAWEKWDSAPIPIGFPISYNPVSGPHQIAGAMGCSRRLSLVPQVLAVIGKRIFLSIRPTDCEASA
jgi:hypothetical protein